MIDEQKLIENLECWKCRLDSERDDMLIVILELVIDKVKAAPVVDKWHEGYPSKKGDYLVNFASGFIGIAEFADGKFWEGRDEIKPVAWMELPPKYKVSLREKLFGRKKD